jgi:hypothetical protein
MCLSLRVPGVQKVKRKEQTPPARGCAGRGAVEQPSLNIKPHRMLQFRSVSAFSSQPIQAAGSILWRAAYHYCDTWLTGQLVNWFLDQKLPVRRKKQAADQAFLLQVVPS